MSPRSRTWLRRSAYFLFYYVIACSLLGIWLAEATLRPPRPLPDVVSAANANAIATDNRANWTEVSINSPLDTQALRAWLFRPADPAAQNGNAVILLHGLGDTRSGPLAFAPFLLRAGYTVLIPDSRAHGLSSGDLATYGLRESADLREWVSSLTTIEQARSEKPPGQCVFALGESMGASILLQTLPTEPRICAAVAESPFATFREIGFDRIGQSLFLGPATAHLAGRTLLRPVLEAGLLYIRWRYGLPLGGISPADDLAASSTPVLLIHGTADSNIPPRHSLLLLDRARSSRLLHAGQPGSPSPNATSPSASSPGATQPRILEFWSVPNAPHTGAYSTSPNEFEQRILTFFSAHTPTAAISAASPQKLSRE